MSGPDAGLEGGAVRLLVLAALVVLLVACGLLWMRFGAQVFLDAALTAWKTCF